MAEPSTGHQRQCEHGTSYYPDDHFSDITEFDRTVTREGDERVYVFSATTEDGSPVMSVSWPSDGRQATRPDAWEKAVSQATEVERVRDFPEIGSRAQMQAPSFSPDGALSGVVFATSDGLFDVLVSTFEASSATPRGVLTATDAARRVEKAYDDTFR